MNTSFCLHKAILSIVLLGIAGCAQQPTAISVQPRLVPVTKETTLTIKAGTLESVEKIGYRPGGPYLKNRILLPGSWNKSAMHKNNLWRIDNVVLEHYRIKPDSVQIKKINSIPLTAPPQAYAAVENGLIYALGGAVHFVAHTDYESRVIEKIGSIISQITGNEQQFCAISTDQQLWMKSRGGLHEFKLDSPVTSLALYNQQCVLAHENGDLSFYALGQDISLQQLRTQSKIYDLKASRDYLHIAHAETGVSFYDGQHWAGSYNKLGIVTNLAIENERVITVDQRGTASLFDISNVAAPLLIADYSLEIKPDKIELYKLHALVLDQQALHIIDFSVPSTPAITNLGVNLGGSRRSFKQNELLFVADWFAGLHIYDVGNPNSPRLLSSYHTPGSPKGVVVKNGYAFVADDDMGLQILDVRNPRRPKLVAHLSLPGLAYTMRLKDGLLYLASHRGGMHIIDVKNPRRPKLVNTFDTPGKTWAVALKNNLAFLADDNSGVLVLDVENSERPVALHQYDTGGQAEDIIIHDDIAYIAYFNQGVHIVDISNPRSFKPIAHIESPGNARGLALRDNRLYVAAWRAGVLIYDVSKLNQPYLLGQYDTDGATWGIEVDEPYVYALDWWGGVKVLNAQRPTQPRKVAEYQASDIINHVTTKNEFGFLSSGHRGLQVFDLTNVENPVWATGIDLDGYAHTSLVSDNLLYVATGEGGLAVLDIRSPFHTRLIRQITLSHAAHTISMAGNRLYIAELGGAVSVFDIRDPTTPHYLQTRHLSARQIVALPGNMIALIDSKNQLNVLPDFLAKSTETTIAQNQAFIRFYQNGIISYENNRGFSLYSLRDKNLIKLREIPLIRSRINDFQIYNHKLYILSDERLTEIINLLNGALEASYESTQRLSQIAINHNGLFFSGEKRLSSMAHLPPLNVHKNSHSVKAIIPAGLPIGSYDLEIYYGNGRVDLQHNAFEVGFPKPNKPTFTLEQFKEKLKQGIFEGKAP